MGAKRRKFYRAPCTRCGHENVIAKFAGLSRAFNCEACAQALVISKKARAGNAPGFIGKGAGGKLDVPQSRKLIGEMLRRNDEEEAARFWQMRREALTSSLSVRDTDPAVREVAWQLRLAHSQVRACDACSGTGTRRGVVT